MWIRASSAHCAIPQAKWPATLMHFFFVSMCMSHEFLVLVAMTFCGIVFDVAGNLFSYKLCPKMYGL